MIYADYETVFDRLMDVYGYCARDARQIMDANYPEWRLNHA